MRKFKPRQPRSLLFRLLALAASGLLLTAAFVPEANATLLVYFNFEDSTTGAAPDFISDQTPANAGGGIQASTMTINYGPGAQGDFASGPGLLLNRSFVGDAAGSTGNDSDIADPGQALNLRSSKDHNLSYIQFPVNAFFFQNMTLSYATNNNGNGFTTQTAFYSIDGGATFTQFGQVTGLTAGSQIVTFPLPSGANAQPGLVVRIGFSGGKSNGQDLQTVIDNVQLYGTVIPEPATVVGGLLGAFGLCWHQRRRLVRFLQLRRAA